MIYPAPIITVTKNRFTKHYFIGSKRIASKIGTGRFSNVYGIGGNNITAGQKDYAARMMQIEKQREEYYKQLGTPPGVPTMKGATADPDNTGIGYNSIITDLGDHSVPEGWIQHPKFNGKGDVPGPPIQWSEPESPDNAQPGYGYIANDTTKEETFFYHSDHLGSTSYITDAKANITQFDAYLPYGELLVDEHSSSEELPYKFNGKQFDDETGLYYYGARYMNPVASIWYGVDPLSEKYPYIGGVVYCEGNPVVQIDDFGLAPKKPKRKVNNNSNQFNPLNAPTYEIEGIIYRGRQMVGEKPLEPDYTIETLLIGGLSSVRVGSIARSTFSGIKNLFSGGSEKVSKRGSLRPTLSKKNQNINQNGSLGSSLPIFKKW